MNEGDDWFDPILGYTQDPRDQHPAGKARRFFRHTRQGGVEYFPDFDAWLQYGATLGFCSVPCCDIHEGYPLSDEEVEAFDNGDDPCIIVARLYPVGGMHVHDEEV